MTFLSWRTPEGIMKQPVYSTNLKLHQLASWLLCVFGKTKGIIEINLLVFVVLEITVNVNLLGWFLIDQKLRVTLFFSDRG